MIGNSDCRRRRVGRVVRIDDRRPVGMRDRATARFVKVCADVCDARALQFHHRLHDPMVAERTDDSVDPLLTSLAGRERNFEHPEK
jgi:hypothetical protein